MRKTGSVEESLPIFEFHCTGCNRIYSFLSLSASPTREPVCPRCGTGGLRRVPSAFAVKRAAPPAKDRAVAGGGGAADEARLEQEAMRMVGDLSESDVEDPRVMARMMRRLAAASGEPLTPTMEEMFSRIEAGEDPDELEEELGPQLEAEMEEGGGESAPPTRDEGLYNL
jgi:putative FmdB family regulatory protein